MQGLKDARRCAIYELEKEEVAAMQLTQTAVQKQKLSTQTVLSLGVLQMGTEELCAFVESAVLENPALEYPAGAAPAAAAAGPEAVGDDLREITLQQELRSQVRFSALEPALARETAWVIDTLDRDGYLRLPEAAEPDETLLSAIALVQSLEPAGVGARSLSECLSLQLRRSGGDELAERIVRDHLEDMAAGRLQRIAGILGAPREEIARACERIRSLEPRPGALYDAGEEPRLRADFVARKSPDGITVELSDQAVPSLVVRADYAALRKQTDDAAVAAYLDEHLTRARDLVDALVQRRNTMARLASLLAERQRDFFLSGPANLRPFLMTEAAQTLGVHVSTVSRIVKGKYIACAWGVYPLARLFSRPSGADGASSKSAVLERLRALIEGEDAAHPHSDETLAALLRGQGIDISRRTVAKYRSELGIPSAPGRRVLKKSRPEEGEVWTPGARSSGTSSMQSPAPSTL